MCGIAGVMTRDGSPPDGRLLAAFDRALVHRGPDGGRSLAAGPVGLVHRRLAIIDLAGGDQPLTEPGGALLIANGEIYNYIELWQQLAGTAFATRSDCEPILHLYRRHGLDFVAHLRGMYALALYDPGEEVLLLARDPFGIKPLYYVETDSLFAFASEPQALIQAGLVTPRVAPRARAELLQLQFTTGRDTAIEGIRRVLPGELLVVEGGRVLERRQTPSLPDGPPLEIGEDEALERLDAALVDSVRVHQRADVPYGLFLSGGIDSSALLALMARLNDRPVRAYTAGFPGGGVHDERDHARLLAAKVGADSVEVAFSEDDFWRLLPQVCGSVDDPAADYATLPTYKLAEVAARDLKVVLCGEGGDEIFAGYGRYRSALRPIWAGGKAMRSHGAFDGLDVLRIDLTGWRDAIVAAEGMSARGGRTKLQVAQAVDNADWLPNDLLIKLDRCLMAHGLEGRTPFLDPVVMGIGYRLPDGLKLKGGRGKYLLRRWLARHLPEADPFSRKRGFSVPFGDCIARQGVHIGPLVASQPGIAEIAHPDRVRALFTSGNKHARFAAWVLLFYALWHQRVILGAPAGSDAFATLAQT